MENCLQRHSMPVVTAIAAWNLRYEIENGKLKMKKLPLVSFHAGCYGNRSVESPL
jgi:hypothetical protein